MGNVTADGKFSKKGDRVTPELFLKLLDERRDTVKQLFANVRVGDPRDGETLVGPLIDEAALEGMRRVLGDTIERVDAVAGGFYVRPALVEAAAQEGSVLQETFAPILYVLRYRAPESIARFTAAAEENANQPREARGEGVPRLLSANDGV